MFFFAARDEIIIHSPDENIIDAMQQICLQLPHNRVAAPGILVIDGAGRTMNKKTAHHWPVVLESKMDSASRLHQ
ncbi:hypothetical protein, partial [Herbaspirillum sp. B65]|uniref:hypothetical protein n=1 Tax=Herbaspirillum sp. B65 TaxID=137708 RepID=UPI001C255B40